MKRLMLVPALALALAACSEVPTAPRAAPDAPLFNHNDMLENNGLAFAEGGATTGCYESSTFAWTCDIAITGAGDRQINVVAELSVTWRFICQHKSWKKPQVEVRSGASYTYEATRQTGDPIEVSTVLTIDTPTWNACSGLRGPYSHAGFMGVEIHGWTITAGDADDVDTWLLKDSRS